MDPNATLAILRVLVSSALDSDSDDARELAEHADALDAWLSRGGFLPSDWGRA